MCQDEPHVLIVSVVPTTIGSAVTHGNFYGQVTNPVQHVIIKALYPDGDTMNITLRDAIIGESISNDNITLVDDSHVNGPFGISNPKGYRISAALVYVTNSGETSVVVSGKSIPAGTRVLFLRKPDGTYGLLMLEPRPVKNALTHISDPSDPDLPDCGCCCGSEYGPQTPIPP